MNSCTRRAPTTPRKWDEPIVLEMGSAGRARLHPARRSRPGSRAEVGDAAGADPGRRCAGSDAARAAGDGAAERAAALPAAVADDDGLPHHAGRQSRHLHDEVQPAGQRASGADAGDERSAPAAGRRDGPGDPRDHLPTSSRCSARSPGWTPSPSSRPAARRRSSPTPASSAPTTRSRGEVEQRNEIISTAFSHPIDCAAPAVAGFRVITLMPGPNGYPELDALKAVVSERTAGLMMTNPEDTGIFNPHVEEFTRIVHEAGGLCAYDQANANGILGHHPRPRERVRSLPVQPAQDLLGAARLDRRLLRRGRLHGGAGEVPAGARWSSFDGERYSWDYDRPREHRQGPQLSTATSRRCCAPTPGSWRTARKGCEAVAETAVLNNNYLATKLGADPRCRDPVRRQRPPLAGGPLQLAAAARRDRRRHGGCPPPDRRLRAAGLLHQPPSGARARTVHPRTVRRPSRKPISTSTRTVFATSTRKRAPIPKRVRSPRTPPSIHRIHEEAIDDPTSGR